MWAAWQLIILERKLIEVQRVRQRDRQRVRQRETESQTERETYPGPELHHLSLDEAVFVLSLQ